MLFASCKQLDEDLVLYLEGYDTDHLRRLLEATSESEAAQEIHIQKVKDTAVSRTRVPAASAWLSLAALAEAAMKRYVVRKLQAVR